MMNYKGKWNSISLLTNLKGDVKMRLVDALQEDQWDYFINQIYDTCDELGATDNITANLLIDSLSNMEINAIPKPSYRVPSVEEYMERHGTKKQIAGFEKRNNANG